LAPVGDSSGSYHICLDGNPAYSTRFERTFGFYCALAAVEAEGYFFHIHPDGSPAYSDRWNWCGNFQQNRCTIRNQDGGYFHINKEGVLIEGGPHSYAGDFREDIAVVRDMEGLCRHINLDGSDLNGKKFLDLDVFHKGFALARDEVGWFHIDKCGLDVTSGRRHSEIEPFYNGQALVKTRTGDSIVVDENGIIQAKLPRSAADLNADFQRTSISYWTPLAIRFGILSGLAGGENLICPSEEEIAVLQHSWVELGLLDENAQLTAHGEHLSPGQLWRDRFLYWTGPQFTAWAEGESRISNPENRTDFFLESSGDKDICDLIHRVIDSYAKDDWKNIGVHLNIPTNAVVADIGGGRGALLKEIGNTVQRRILIDRPEVVNGLNLEEVEILPLDIFSDELPYADYYLMSRILHDWNDCKCISLLNAIPKSSKIIVIERISEHSHHGLMSLNMLLLTGGRERMRSEWQSLFGTANWNIEKQTQWFEHSIMFLGSDNK